MKSNSFDPLIMISAASLGLIITVGLNRLVSRYSKKSMTITGTMIGINSIAGAVSVGTLKEVNTSNAVYMGVLIGCVQSIIEWNTAHQT